MPEEIKTKVKAKTIKVNCSCCDEKMEYRLDYPGAINDIQDALCFECSCRGCYLPGRRKCNEITIITWK